MKLKSYLWKKRLDLQGNVTGKANQLREWQWLPKRELHALQNDRLSKLLQHAYEYVPYYTDILEHSGAVRNGHIVLDQFGDLPLLDKSILRRYAKALTSTDLDERRWYKNTSGGSTGEPVELIQDQAYHNWMQAIKILDDEWSGQKIGDRIVKLWGSERDLFAHRKSVKVELARWLRNELALNTFRMTVKEKQQYADQINAYKPNQILAYVESIYELARYMEEQQLLVHSPHAIMCSAGTLHPHMRQVIERVFQAKVFNRYGSREVGDIACECDHHQGLHVSSPTHMVEIVRSDGSPCERGEVGEIVVTSLVNFSMPLIRYRIGDMGAWAEEDCSCGRAYPLLKEVTGRVTDTFKNKHGTQVHGEYFTHLFYFQNWVDKFQVIQERIDCIRILLVVKQDHQLAMKQNEILQIQDKVRLVMGEDCEVQFTVVDEIKPTASGKYRYTISKVNA